MTSPLRIYVIRTLWEHWGSRAGIVRFLHYLEPGAYSVHDHLTPFDDHSFPLFWGPARIWLRNRLKRKGMTWYTAQDLWTELVAGCRTVSRGVDVIHYLDPEHGVQYLPLLARYFPRPPRVMATFHQPPKLLPKILRRDVVQRLDHVVVVSPDQVPFFASCLPEDRISVILHGIDTEFFRPAPRDGERGTWTCLTVGHNLRDFDALRNVAKRLRGEADVRFQVVSSRETGVEDLPNVTVHSGIPDTEFRAMYQAADVLFLPLKDATANNALLEGFACGLPAVTTDLPALRAYAPGEEAVLVQNNEPGLMADAIIALRDNEGLRARMAAAARRRAEELSWPKMAQEYDNVYRQVCRR